MRSMVATLRLPQRCPSWLRMGTHSAAAHASGLGERPSTSAHERLGVGILAEAISWALNLTPVPADRSERPSS
ncbi:MAG TPA: hypothetical protein VE646_10830, partial [Actinomycetota bacterium]|nr:hypothetical protein [Actinomycetota bacterium]